MKQLFVILAILATMIPAQADQYQQVMQQFDQYNQSLANGTQYQPIQQGNYVYVPVQMPQYQQPQSQQPQQTKLDMRGTVQNVASMASDIQYGIQSIRTMVNSFKGGF